ncbi:sucrose-specific PTS transporter subunit IIBC [Streptococcus acidominimus]|uniref:protein-N(pi)-phosphohistidine--sucrose phosphotransferase n=1 Tax=Streptococcus acidominimus TaxID=1326 RepID=A0A4Y9FSZ6_STRAI|nr:sucrose-specific PTS transporter subunit IIBC [Streptococcus acidominimus]MBF0817989.1 PTS beta-glucoside transporter subunit IIBCA [Streptococcus acidominimus]MBF0839922.1 PTS beta-glucoside transporter subunit IIBCA [Streptococcus acidominimus]MBF0848252.1 PTS beta-glucoside transporter subunit IIBCA [Streptococcus danieliae]TFU31972.1 PTS beta-glucoside transporter subunit IIBCA [Streptococcus acidominimus]
MDYNKVAKDVIAAVGRDNLVAVAHCATRLRLVLKDDSKVDQVALDQHEDVKGTFKASGQYQVIIGPGDVNFVYAELIKETGLKEVSTDDLKTIAASDQKFNPIMALIKLLSDIFVPIIPALVAGGLLMALRNFLTSEGLFGPQSIEQMFPAIQGVSEMIQLMSAAPFMFLPILVGISAAKRFGANQFLGAAIGMIMTTPALGGGEVFWDIFGMQVAQTSYIYQVIPVLAAVWVLSILEKFFHKHLPAAVDFTFTPLLSVMLTGFLTFTVIGPVMLLVSNGITNGIVWLYNTTGFLGMTVFGGTYSLIVMTGLHQSFPAIETQLLTAFNENGTGYGDFIFVVASMANVAQGAATLAVWFLTKDSKTKGLTSSAAVSAFLGITEPALFGVNLKYRFPFFCALAGSAVGAAVAGLTHVIAVSLGAAGFLGFLSINASSIPMYIVCELIAFAVAFALTFAYGKTKAVAVFVAEAPSQTAEVVKEAETSLINEETLVSPLSGEVVALEHVNDPVFSSGAMGKGLAVKPSEGIVYAPADAEVTIAFETGHAYGLKTASGAEILIHIGIDTVSMDGAGFEKLVAAGDTVTAGTPIAKFDASKIAAAGLDDTTMIIVTNTEDFATVETLADTTIAHGEAFIKVAK